MFADDHEALVQSSYSYILLSLHSSVLHYYYFYYYYYYYYQKAAVDGSFHSICITSPPIPSSLLDTGWYTIYKYDDNDQNNDGDDDDSYVGGWKSFWGNSLNTTRQHHSSFLLFLRAIVSAICDQCQSQEGKGTITDGRTVCGPRSFATSSHMASEYLSSCSSSSRSTWWVAGWVLAIIWVHACDTW